MPIILSPQTTALAAQYFEEASPAENIFSTGSVSLEALNHYFDQLPLLVLNSTKKTLAEALHSAVLQDIKLHYQAHWHLPIENPPTNQQHSTAMYYLTLIAGLLLFGCEGFDGIAAVMGLLAINPFITLGIAFLFAGVSIAVNVNVRRQALLIDHYAEQLKTIQAMILLMETQLVRPTYDELDEYAQLVRFLRTYEERIIAYKSQLETAQNKPHVKLSQYAVAGLIGTIVFCGGFFSGQAVAIFLAGFFISAVAVTAWPVTVGAMAIGLAALAVYLYVQLPEVKDLVGHWFGHNETRLNELPASMNEEFEHLDNRLTLERTLLDDATIREREQTNQLDTLRDRVISLEAMVSERRMDRSPTLPPSSIEADKGLARLRETDFVPSSVHSDEQDSACSSRARVSRSRSLPSVAAFFSGIRSIKANENVPAPVGSSNEIHSARQ